MRLLKSFITLIVLFTAVHCSYAQYNKEYFYWTGRRFMMDDNFREAIQTLNILLRFDEDAYEGYFLRGIAKYNLDDLIGAEADFSIAISKNPVFTTAFTYRAITRSRLGNYDDALKDFKEAIELRPDLPNPYYSRAVTRLLNQQFKEAISDFDNFLKFEKKVADAYINRGVCYLYLKDTLKAYEDFDRGIRTNRENPNGYNRRGTLFLTQRRLEEAEKDFDKAIKCDSTIPLSYFNRALVYNDTNRPMQSLKDLNRVIQLDSTSSITYFNRAIIKTQIGDYNNALEDYNKVSRYSPNNVLVYYNRALLLTQLGEIKRAIKDYSKAIELYPDFANAYLGRSYLRSVLKDYQGAKKDKATAEKKIAEYRSRLNDSIYSIFADTAQKFNKLLSFESRIAGKSFERIATHNDDDSNLSLLPLYRFSFMRHDGNREEEATTRFFSQRAEDFKKKITDSMFCITRRTTNISPDTLVLLNKAYRKKCINAREDKDWISIFCLAISETLVRQYTSAVTTFSQAIEMNPANPFLYLNRAATRAEMIDFISSIDNAYQRISIENDPASKLKSSHTRTYNYDEAIDDLNKAIKLYPQFAYAFYNRANLKALSGQLPEAFEDYTKAIELNAHFAEAYYNRGLIQIFMKDTKKGCLDISKAGELGIDGAYQVLKTYRD
ncbi:MAG: tetratricopeptide repeat protein [Alistipes sp.]|nr:tetratricopeptide repeat protein [Candidatus Alistipes equi]